ncbi:6-bladed beta-propeller [Chitinophaga filiformis]|uniref:6-bladed beta-propeller n=1 Tax=Chitinophaga filiformis TaxID=104663 RepID=UPI001F2744ED|nr:6-bladed beta-propeller [Chitinophaga filiformis]MCF6407499.1 6-bladed beta-propeller [Chitinophaga filiformis]
MLIRNSIRSNNVHRLYVLLALYFIIILAIPGCNSSHQSGDTDGSLLQIRDGKIDRLLDIDSLVEPGSLKFTSLENSRDSAFISELECRFTSDDGVIFLNKRLNTLVIFSYDGKLKKELDLNQLIGFDLKIADIRNNPYNSHIEILDLKNNLYSFSSDGNFLRVHEQLKSYPHSLFYPLSDSAYVLYNNFVTNAGKADASRFYVLKHFNKTRSWWPLDTSLVIVLPVNDRQFYQSAGELRFFDPLFPVIYTVSDTGLTPKYRLKYQQFNLTTKNALDVSSIIKEAKFHPVPAMNYFIESDRYCIMEYILGQHRYSSVCDKASGKSLGVSYFGLGLSNLGMTLYNPLFAKDSKNFLTVVYGEEIIRNKEKLSDFKALEGLKNYDKVLVSFRFK